MVDGDLSATISTNQVAAIYNLSYQVTPFLSQPSGIRFLILMVEIFLEMSFETGALKQSYAF